jgi:hypothetical protein
VTADLRALFGSYGWHRDAACKDVDDANLFVPDESVSISRRNQANAGALLALLICSTCSVRPPCLLEGFRELSYPAFRVDEDGTYRPLPATTSQTQGIWGGATISDRHDALAEGRTVDQAAEFLHSTFDQRLNRRIAAWRAHVEEYGVNGTNAAAVAAILARRINPNPARFDVRKRPGPGRGHLGPAGAYARQHGCSLSTAYRRLKAAA